MKIGDIIRLTEDAPYLGRYSSQQVEVTLLHPLNDTIRVRALDGYEFDILRCHVDYGYFNLQCQCGAESIGSPFHGTWCDLFKSPWED